MKNLVLASALGTLAGAFAVPAIGGPVHYALTRPYSVFGTLPQSGGSITFGQVPLDFVLTDVVPALTGAQGALPQGTLTVNGTPVLGLQHDYNHNVGFAKVQPIHMASGLFIPAGSTIGFTSSGLISGNLTLAGYVQ